MTQKEHAELYQPLFDLMMDDHNLILTISEMDEIIEASRRVKQNFAKAVDQNIKKLAK